MTDHPLDSEPTQRGRHVDIYKFTIEETGNGLFQILVLGRPLLTHAGHPTSHRSQELLQQIINELDGQGRVFVDENKIVDPHLSSSYTILDVQKRLTESGAQFVQGFVKWLRQDPMLYRCAGPEVTDQYFRWGPVLEYLSDLKLDLPCLVGTSIDRSDYESDKEYCDTTRSSTPKHSFSSRIESEYEQLLPEEKAVVFHLSRIHRGPVLFPLVLVSGRCTPNEYTSGVMAAHAMLVDVFSDVSIEQYRESYECIKNDAQLALSYLASCGISPLRWRYFKGKTVPFEETRRCEFKEVKGQNPVDAIKNAADEYVVAFLNCDGGHILWGIRDADGIVVGVRLTNEQRDKIRLAVVAKLNEIQPKIDPTRYRISFHSVVENDSVTDDLYVVEIYVPWAKSREPFYTGGHECFVRVDGAKRKLSGPALTDWIRQRLQQE